MTSLLDLSSDLINEAKLATQSEKKLYNLEQVKEIIFHRDTSLLPHVIPALFDLMLDRSVAVRRFLVRLAGDALKHNQDVTPHVLGLFSFLIMEGNDKLLESIADVMCRYYDKISVKIALMPPKTTSFQQTDVSTDNQHDPTELWYQFRSICNTIVECISAQRSENLRCQCLKLCEQMILFALLQTGGSSNNDPRLRQASMSRKTVQEISMHHAFINRVELEKEAESILAKMVLWARRGGTQQAPFSPMIQCRLGQILALVTTERPHTLKRIVPALNYLLLEGQNKGNICSQMTAVGRQQLSVAILRLLRIAPKYMSNQGAEDEQIVQLRHAVTVLDDRNLATDTSLVEQNQVPSGSDVVTLLSGVHSSDPRKRKLEQMAAAAAVKVQEKTDSLLQDDKSAVNTKADVGITNFEEYEEDVDEDITIDEESIRQNALSAVEAHLTLQAESYESHKRSKLDDMLSNLTGSNHPPLTLNASLPLPMSSSDFSGISKSTTSVHQNQSNITTLASDLVDFPQVSVGNSLRLVTLVSSATPGSGTSRAAGHLQSIPPPVEIYADLSLGSLSKLISQTICVRKIEKNSRHSKFSHAALLTSCVELKMVMRMILSMCSRDLDQHIAYLQFVNDKVTHSALAKHTVQTVALLKSRGVHDALMKPAKQSSDVFDIGTDAVPKNISLPRTLWQLIGHALVSQERYHTVLISNLSSSVSATSAKHQAAEIIRKINPIAIGGSSKQGRVMSGQRFDFVDLLILLLKEIFIRRMANNEGAVVGIPSRVLYLCEGFDEYTESATLGDRVVGEENCVMHLYEALCIVILSRTLQKRILRPCAGRILHQLPQIPIQCVKLLELLLLTGTKPASATGLPSSGRQSGLLGGTADRGTRLAALEILGSLLFSPLCMNDSQVFRHALCPLLWLSVSEDLSSRTSAVSCLVGACKRIERENQPGEGLYHVQSAIMLFALQATLHCTGDMMFYSQFLQQKDWFQHQSCLRQKYLKSNVDSTSDLYKVLHENTGQWLSTGESQLEQTDKMEVEEKQAIILEVDEVLAVDSFDGGVMYGGLFCECPQDHSSHNSFLKRHFHLMSQLCMNKHTLLKIYFNIYEYSLSSSKRENTESETSVDCKSVLCASYMQSLRYHVEKEVLSIVPLLLSSRRGFSRQKYASSATATPFEIASHLVEHCNIAATLPLFCLVMEKVMEPISMPASENMVQLGRELHSDLPDDPLKICLLLPLLGGMTSSEVTDVLPFIITELFSPSLSPLVTEPLNSPSQSDDEMESIADKQRSLRNSFLRKAFHRITQTRPPPLSRAKLLVALHRIDVETSKIKLKDMLDVIGMCIAEKEEYNADVLKEAFTLLLEDDVPSKALMRTVLLSAQAIPEMQKFTLHEVIPKLVRKKAWIVAPKVWEGVLMCLKTFNGQRDFEPTIRAFICLPYPQLKSIISIASYVKGILNRILRAMPSADIEECVSGRWAGIEDVNISQTDKEKEEKEKFIQSILQK